VRELWLARVYFFLWIGGVGFYAPFINLFYRQQGMTGAEIGLIITIGSAVGLVAAPLWGRWSDAGAPLTRLLQLGLLITGTALVVLSQQRVFGIIAVVAGCQAIGVSGLFPLSDALALRVSQARRAGYGSVRVFGSAGWAVIVLVSGWLLNQAGLEAGFFGAAALFLVAGLVLFAIPAGIHAPNVMRSREPSGLKQAARQVLDTPALLGLAIALIVRGTLSDGHMQFGNIFLEELGATTAVIGIASMLQAAVELPGMFMADRVVKRLGALWTLLISFAITGGKLALVLVEPAVWSVMLTRAIEGIAFSLFTIGLITYVTGRAPTAQMATMLALFTVTLTALIQILGAPIGGVVFDAVGAYWLYALALVGNGLAFVILFASNARDRRTAT
jgi:PPP family 3-phenylpropionic acid transporter